MENKLKCDYDMKYLVIDKTFVSGHRIILEENDYHYLKNVRRVKVGDYIKALIEDEVMILYISEIKKDRILLEIVDKKEISIFVKPDITVFQGLIKSKKMDLLVSRLSEVGISELYPIITERSVFKGDLGKNKLDRWKRISKEGSKISGLEKVLRINIPQKLEELDGKKLNNFDIKLLFSTDSRSLHIRTYLERLKNAVNKSFCLFFGPEGGFSEIEESYLTNLGFIKIGMGPFTMRAETAAIAASTFIRIFYSNDLWQG